MRTNSLVTVALRYFSISLVLLLTIGESVPTAAARYPGVTTGSTITVTTLTDEVNDNGLCSLREAVLAANTDQPADTCPAGNGADTILLPAGQFNLTLEGVGDDEGLTGDLDITEPVTIIGAGKELTIIDGINRNRIFEILPLTSGSITISDLTILNGYGRTGDGMTTGSKGGGIVAQADLTLERVKLFYNHVDPPDGMGGGIFSTTNITIRDSLIEENWAEDYGAIFCKGKLIIEDSTLRKNHSYYYPGITAQTAIVTNSLFEGNYGPIGPAAIRASDLVIVHSTFRNNETGDDRSGAILAQQSLKMYHTLISQNSGIDGGGIYISGGGKAVIHASTIQDNSAEHAGGGIYLGTNSSLTIINSTIAGNRNRFISWSDSVGGGGIYNEGGWVTVINSTISGNTSEKSGGGYYQKGGKAAFKFVTITGNSAGDAEGTIGIGGGLALEGGTLYMRGTILAGNQVLTPGMSAPDFACINGSLVSKGFNLIGVQEGCSFTPARGDLMGTLTSPLSPFLAPLADNGGPTFTHALLVGSPTLDQVLAGCPPTDQRWAPRPVDGNGDGAAFCDIGAYEAGGIPAFNPASIDVNLLEVIDPDGLIEEIFWVFAPTLQR